MLFDFFPLKREKVHHLNTMKKEGWNCKRIEIVLEKWIKKKTAFQVISF